MTLVVLSVLGSYLFYREILRPVVHYNAWNRRRQYEEEVREFKAKAVRRFYPVLREYDSEDLEQEFGLDQIYNSIGRAYLRNR